MPIAFEPPPTQAATASGQPAGELEHLRARLVADDLLEVADHRGERVRAGDRAEDVVGGRRRWSTQSRNASLIASFSVREPGRDRDDLGAEQPHPGDVERLPLGVDLAHVDGALEAEQRRGGRGGDAVLAGAGLGDDARLADALGEQRLAEHVVDLVRAGVVEVLALEDDAGAAGVLGEARHLGDDATAGRCRCGAARASSAWNAGSAMRLAYAAVELVERGDERLGHEAPAEARRSTGPCCADARPCVVMRGHSRRRPQRG